MTKEELENKKLSLEIKKLSIPWYENIEFWKVFIPTLAVLISLYFTFGKGIIDSEKSKLEIQKEQLKLDITRFEMKSSDLSNTIKSKDSTKNILEKQIDSYETQKSDLINEISALNKKIGLSNAEIENIKTEKTKDKKFYQDKLRSQYKEEKANLEELNKLKSSLNQKDVYIASMKAELDYLSSKIKLTDMEKNEIQIRKSTASSDELKKQIDFDKISIEKLNEKYEAKKRKIEQMSDYELSKEFELYFLKREKEN